MAESEIFVFGGGALELDVGEEKEFACAINPDNLDTWNLKQGTGQAELISTSWRVNPQVILATVKGISPGKVTLEAVEKDGTTTSATITILSDTVTSTLSFDTDGGSPQVDSISKSTRDPSSPPEFTIPSTKPAKDGYTFSGWVYSGTTYQPGSTFTGAWGTDYTFKASWATAVDPSVITSFYITSEDTRQGRVTLDYNVDTGIWESYTFTPRFAPSTVANRRVVWLVSTNTLGANGDKAPNMVPSAYIDKVKTSTTDEQYVTAEGPVEFVVPSDRQYAGEVYVVAYPQDIAEPGQKDKYTNPTSLYNSWELLHPFKCALTLMDYTGSTVIGSGEYISASNYTLNVTGSTQRTRDAQYEYTFVGWSLSRDTFAAGSTFPTSITTSTATLYPVYKRTLRSYTVSVSVKGGAGGTIDKSTLSGVYYGTTWSGEGTRLTLSFSSTTIDGTTYSYSDGVTARPDTGMSVDGWTPANGRVTGDASISVTFGGVTGAFVSVSPSFFTVKPGGAPVTSDISVSVGSQQGSVTFEYEAVVAEPQIVSVSVSSDGKMTITPVDEWSSGSTAQTEIAVTVFARKTDGSREKIGTGARVTIVMSSQYTLVYDFNNGDTPETVTKVQQTNVFTIIQDIPVYTGHIFKGWSFTKNPGTGDKTYTAGDVVAFDGTSARIYAVWGSRRKFVLTYDTNLGEGMTIHLKDSNGNLLAATKPIDQSETSEDTIVEFEVDSTIDYINRINGKDADGADITIVESACPGYVFNGWYGDKECTVKAGDRVNVDINGASVSHTPPPAGEESGIVEVCTLTLYASWITGAKVEVRALTDVQSTLAPGVTDKGAEEMVVTYTSVNLPGIDDVAGYPTHYSPKPRYYRLSGTNLVETDWGPGTPISIDDVRDYLDDDGSLTLYVGWTKSRFELLYTISGGVDYGLFYTLTDYGSDEGEYSLYPSDTKKLTYKSVSATSVALPDTFCGLRVDYWVSSADRSKPQVGSTVEMTQAMFSLGADGWTKTSTKTPTTYTAYPASLQGILEYVSNGGSGRVQAQTTTEVESGDDKGKYIYTLRSGEGLTREGYTFGGWRSAGSGTIYAPGAEYKTSSKYARLYAVWTPNQGPASAKLGKVVGDGVTLSFTSPADIAGNVVWSTDYRPLRISSIGQTEGVDTSGSALSAVVDTKYTVVVLDRTPDGYIPSEPVGTAVTCLPSESRYIIKAERDAVGLYLLYVTGASGFVGYILKLESGRGACECRLVKATKGTDGTLAKSELLLSGSGNPATVTKIAHRFSAQLSEMPMIILPSRCRYVIDLGNTERISLMVTRVNPRDADDASGDQRRWTNRKWVDYTRSFFDTWQNNNYDYDSGKHAGGYALSLVPPMAKMYPSLRKNVFLSSALNVSYGNAVADVGFEFAVGSMLGRAAISSDSVYLVKWHRGRDYEDVVETTTYSPKVIAPTFDWDVPLENGTPQVFMGWLAHDDGRSPIYQPGSSLRLDTDSDTREFHFYPSFGSARKYWIFTSPGTCGIPLGPGEMLKIVAVGGGAGSYPYSGASFLASSFSDLVNQSTYELSSPGGEGKVTSDVFTNSSNNDVTVTVTCTIGEGGGRGIDDINKTPNPSGLPGGTTVVKLTTPSGIERMCRASGGVTPVDWHTGKYKGKAPGVMGWGGTNVNDINASDDEVPQYPEVDEDPSLPSVQIKNKWYGQKYKCTAGGRTARFCEPLYCNSYPASIHTIEGDGGDMFVYRAVNISGINVVSGVKPIYLASKGGRGATNIPKYGYEPEVPSAPKSPSDIIPPLFGGGGGTTIGKSNQPSSIYDRLPGVRGADGVVLITKVSAR